MTEKDTAAAPSAPSDFIREIVAADVAAGKNGGHVVTRFPPEPSDERSELLFRLKQLGDLSVSVPSFGIPIPPRPCPAHGHGSNHFVDRSRRVPESQEAEGTQ